MERRGFEPAMRTATSPFWERGRRACGGHPGRGVRRRVIVLEKNRRPGVKILMSGGTRCNLTNARGLRRLDAVSGPIDPAFDPALVPGHPGHPGMPLAQAARSSARRSGISTSTRRSGCSSPRGVATKVEGNGKIFPVSDRAVDVLECPAATGSIAAGPSSAARAAVQCDRA